jgi:SAM-dependent methyltransferase
MTEPRPEPAVSGTAARGFTAGVDAYERSRPDYPVAAVNALVARMDLRPGRTVLDLGAGTGKLTRLLVPSGATVVAVEPLEAMRARLEAAAPAVTSLSGTAEAIPLPDASVDAATCAQAFHWFEPQRAFAELHRVIRADGLLALIWNVRDESITWVRTMGDIVDELVGGEPRHKLEEWLPEARRTPLFEYLEVTETPHAQELTPDGVIDRLRSISVVAAAAPERRADVETRVAELLRTDPVTAGLDVIRLPYSTRIHWLRRRPHPEGTNGGGAGTIPADRHGGTMVQAEGGSTSLPTTREELLVLHKEARARRNAAVGGSHDWETAQAEVGRIEVEIARIERAMDPPQV